MCPVSIESTVLLFLRKYDLQVFVRVLYILGTIDTPCYSFDIFAGRLVIYVDFSPTVVPL